ncbi:tRNA (guanosine(46)-N7)-methyltransferase TrmB [Glycomyces buryatensis]|uniref:tRNA (guanine-N(7)-)-methyltransferase n=1 Tax=Glycomyces buryatensis TaxID=2570927 RepID=A0A4S8QNX8_9ACTN|nr:tRNA (guanosine(46)-N7)-methyltransferase TrmB [Glycomyces buryatensis]THV43139.1 tRNA (guanosine(46)-N7)-methyltransferase TrmB [Glycomyces buryatensis]
MPDQSQQHRHILTFNFRQGRNKPRHDEAMERLWPRYGFQWEPADGRIDFPKLFGRTAPVVLEIGSGNGEAAAAMSDADRERDLLAVEVYPQGIADLMARADELGVDNLRIYEGDALPLLWKGIEPGTLDEIRVYFPDPWHKVRHHKRRIVQRDHVATMRGLLREGGVLHCATDIADYAEQMLEVLSADEGLENTADGFAPRPDHRPVTKFERRGHRAGREIFDLIFRKH